jgi:hypothetical protein
MLKLIEKLDETCHGLKKKNGVVVEERKGKEWIEKKYK